MPWQEVSTVSLREEFITLASREGCNFRELCRRYTISPKTGYKWLRRWQEEGMQGLKDRSKKPHHSPYRTSPELEKAVVKLRLKHPSWGGRKLHSKLRELGLEAVPSPTTITAILYRHDLLEDVPSGYPKAWKRFERSSPNELWQMDFKGHFPTMREGRCHPLTVLDDHSRFALGLYACANEQGTTVKEHLTAIFSRYGLPYAMIMDNGAPWGSDLEYIHTPLKR